MQIYGFYYKLALSSVVSQESPEKWKLLWNLRWKLVYLTYTLCCRADESNVKKAYMASSQ